MLLKSSYGKTKVSFKYFHLPGNYFFKILKSPLFNVLIIESKPLDELLQLSENFIPPYLTNMFSSFVLGIKSNFTF